MKTLIVALTLFPAVSVSAQLPTAPPEAAGFDLPRLEVLHATMQRFVDDGQHAGVITLLARDGKIVDFRAYGHRVVERQLPMERDTICRMYSMSKIITCVATLTLVVDGRLNLNDPVTKFCRS